jgi:hypothetical protein
MTGFATLLNRDDYVRTVRRLQFADMQVVLNTKHAWSILTAVVLVSNLGPSARASSPIAERSCRQHPQLTGRCFTIRGRMNYWNGNPSVRIWRVGTRRILGISEGRFKRDGYVNLPASIEARLSWDSDLFGDFVVCPFTRDEPGVMRLVCVESVTNVTVRPRKDN